jgi:DNA replication protein DnaC
MIDSRTVRLCECRERLKLQRLFESSKITPAFRATTFESFAMVDRPAIIHSMFKSALDYSRRFNEIKDDKNNWLVLLGEPGSGKTHLTMAVANEKINERVKTLYFQHVEGINEMKDILRAGEESLREKVREMQQVEFLVWDDLFKPTIENQGKDKGKPKLPTAFEIEKAFEVLNYRYLNLLPTAISSERTPKELIGIDKATGSRILERGKGHLVVVDGIENNYRLI